MQDKISGQPGPIDTSSRTPKASHTIQENIVRYFHVKSAQEQLVDVLLIAKAHQARLIQQRAQARQTTPTSTTTTGAGLGEEQQPLLAGEQATTTVQGTVQPYVQEEINDLINLANMVGAGSLAQQLIALSKKFPNLTPEDMDTLNGILAQVNDASWKLPDTKKYAFWNAEKDMFTKLMSMNKQSIAEYQSQIKKIQQQIDSFKWFYTDMDNIKNLLDALKNNDGKLTQAQFQQLFSIIEDLQSKYSSLTPEQKTAVDTLLKSLSSLKNSAGIPLTQILSDAYLFQLLQKFDQTHPNYNNDPIQYSLLFMKWVKTQNFETGGSGFFNQIKQYMDQTLAKEGFPFITGASGGAFAKVSTTKPYVIINDSASFWNEVTAATTFSSDSITNFDNSFTTVYNAISAQHQALLDQINSLNLTIDTLNDLDDSFGQSIAATAVMFEIIPGSLPDDFRHAILDHYMPQQEEFLREMAEILYFNNMGADIGNKLLHIILGFGDAGTKFDFAHGLNKDDTGHFVGDANHAASQLKDEQTEAHQDLQKINDALDTIQNLIKDTQNDQQLTATQKSDLIGKLKNYAGDLNASKTQLTQICKTLDNISIPIPQPAGVPAGHFDVSIGKNVPATWQTDLSNMETIVIKGDPDHPVNGFKGGLEPIESEISDDQKSFSDQGQEQQMKLQLTMTEIQQEWSIVSTAIQLLNQMYMAPAQAIYK